MGDPGYLYYVYKDQIALKIADDSGDDDSSVEKDQNSSPPRPPPKPGPGEHPLQYNYCFWFSRRTPGKQTTSYDQNLKLVASFASAYNAHSVKIAWKRVPLGPVSNAIFKIWSCKPTVEQFWMYYSHLVRPGDLSGHSDYHLFKDGIRPMWEDSANKMGGKWIIRLKKGLASRCWENLVLAMLGEQFMVGEEICGAVVSIRYQEDIIALWNRTAYDQVTTSRIRDTLKRILNLPPNTIMEYKCHTDSLKDNSSFRNTDVFMR